MHMLSHDPIQIIDRCRIMRMALRPEAPLTMLDKILNHLKSRDAKVQGVDGSEAALHNIPNHPGHFSGIEVYQRFESTMKSNEPCHPQILETKWQLPLPYDLIFTIIDQYFLDDKPAMLNLTKSCRNLAEVCRPLRYQLVVISSRRHLERVSDSERFAGLLSQSPHIIEYVQHLNIQDNTRMFQGSRPITAEEEGLCYILTRRYPKLSRLHLSLHVVWSILPIQLRHAFSEAFTLPNLREVVFEHVNISTSLLTHLSKITSLEVREGDVLSRSMGIEIPSKICTPERLLFMDCSPPGFIIRNLFAETSPLCVSNLKDLQIYCPGQHLKHLSEPLQACSTTLTMLDLRLSSWGNVPDVLDLHNLPMLTSLTLSVDISTVSSYVITVPTQHFSWLVNTLGTCYQPSRIETITFMILIKEFGLTKWLPWHTLDVLFAPFPRRRWPRLLRFNLQHFKDGSFNVKQDNEGMLKEIILPMTPILATDNLLRLTASGEHLHFWGM